jgi:Rad3-related DNA helicase
MCCCLIVRNGLYRRSAEAEAGGWTTQLCLWALNPALAFQEVAAAARCVVLTSGTLAPMASFASEARTGPLELRQARLAFDQFHVCLKRECTLQLRSGGPGASHKRANTQTHTPCA